MIIAMLASTAAAATAPAATVDRVPQDFPTIQAAVDHGTAPTIRVAPGTYTGATLTRAVHVQGQDAVITRGVRARGLRAAFALPAAASGSAVSGMVVDCSHKGLDLGVYASSRRLGSAAGDVEVFGNRFVSCAQAVTNAGGAAAACSTDRVDGGAYWAVHDNVIDGIATRSDGGRSGGGVGILLYNTEGADVYGNLFVGSVQDRPEFATTGVGLAGCVDCTVSGNQFQVAGGRYWYSAVSNSGANLPGAVASRNLLLADNDAFDDSSPWLGVSFVSRGSVDTSFDGNVGVAFVDHEICGDGALYTAE